MSGGDDIIRAIETAAVLQFPGARRAPAQDSAGEAEARSAVDASRDSVASTAST